MGNFTVESDKEKVAGVLSKMVEAKAVSEHERGNIGMLRAYLMLSGTFLMGLPKFMEMPEDVSATEQVKHLMKWRDDATEKKSVNVVKAVGKMQALTRSSKVHPAGGEAKAA